MIEPLNRRLGRLHSSYRRNEEKKKIFFLRDIEAQILGYPAPALWSLYVTIPSRFYLMNAHQFLQEELLSRIRKDSCKNDPLRFMMSAWPSPYM